MTSEPTRSNGRRPTGHGGVRSSDRARVEDVRARERTKTVYEDDRGQDGKELHDTDTTRGHERRSVALQTQGTHQRWAIIQERIDSAPFCVLGEYMRAD